MKIYLNIKSKRLEKKMTQQELAVKSDIHPQRISEYERGLYIPSIDKIIQIAYALDCKIDDLVSYSDYVKTWQKDRFNK